MINFMKHLFIISINASVMEIRKLVLFNIGASVDIHSINGVFFACYTSISKLGHREWCSVLTPAKVCCNPPSRTGYVSLLPIPAATSIATTALIVAHVCLHH